MGKPLAEALRVLDSSNRLREGTQIGTVKTHSGLDRLYGLIGEAAKVDEATRTALEAALVCIAGHEPFWAEEIMIRDALRLAEE